ncbi:RsmD family RNA methyltransferase [Candidatus Chloroploca sp. M-50]|uniref:Methyltransferase n=1 Tax=Candidatus Chloroploca mongolica TaxID=2528176 RepID=A0ABS4D882_9CHLR|nr:DNA methyltransferase [Candidatus Chloroploca mongolica]MBP1465643.1 RsmD family RNA methyltransferase [Candidatus Chloroploca mongolica]
MTEPPEGDVDPRNRLNELTGREWVYALRSVISTAYPTSGPESYAHDLRRKHPSPKPPQLLAELVRFFTRRDGRVLDPFAGVGGTLLACSLEGRQAVGVDLEPRYGAIYQAVCERLGLAPQPYLIGDARHLTSIPEVQAAPFDLILTDPPYAAMQARAKTGERKKRGQGAATPFTHSPDDLGNLAYNAFLDALHDIVAAALTLLKPRGHLVLFTKDLQPTAEHHNMLHADIVARLRQLPELEYRGYRIWHDQSMNLYPFGYPFAFVANQQHQFILIFRYLPV